MFLRTVSVTSLSISTVLSLSMLCANTGVPTSAALPARNERRFSVFLKLKAMSELRLGSIVEAIIYGANASVAIQRTVIWQVAAHVGLKHTVRQYRNFASGLDQRERKMARILVLLLSALLALSACAAPPAPPQLGADGKPLPRVYRIGPGDTARIQYRILDSVNSLREAAGRPPVQLNAQLNAAAATHSRDMSVQNRPWHFGSDGSSPIDRVRRVGYNGGLVGENISETYETELETLAAWMQEPTTRDVILSPDARNMGFSWLQEDNGKIWWTLVMGD